MALDYLRMKKGIDVGGNNVVFANGNAAPYSQTATGPYNITNDDLTAMGIGSEFTNRTNGEVYRKKSTANWNLTDWYLSSTEAGSTEDGFQNTFMGKTAGSDTPVFTGGQGSGLASGTNLETAINTLDGYIGVAPTALTRANNPIVGSADVNDNIDKLDLAIGSNTDEGTLETRSNNSLTQNTSILAKIGKLDDAIGTNPTNTNYVVAANSIQSNLSALDGQVKTNTDNISTLLGGTVDGLFCKVITDDATLNALALTGTPTFTLPFSDDDVPALIGTDFALNDFIFSRNNAGTCKIFRVTNVAGSVLTVTGVSVQQPVDGGSYPVRYDIIDSPNSKENGAIYLLTNGDANKVASYNWANADGILLSAGYAATKGTVAIGDSVEVALEKVVGNQDDIQTTLGVAQGAVSMGTYTGNTITGNQTAKQNIQELATVIDKLSKRTVYADAGTPSGLELDTVNVSDTNSLLDTVEWIVRVHQLSNNKKYACKIFAIVDVAANTVDWSENTIIKLGTAITGLTFDVTHAGGVLSLLITSSEAVEVKTHRIVL